jgi:hypothetical protein
MPDTPASSPQAPYLLIRQCARKGCDVVRINADGSETLIFHGGRWDARREANTLAKAQGLPLYNAKRGRGGYPGSVVPVPVK